MWYPRVGDVIVTATNFLGFARTAGIVLDKNATHLNVLTPFHAPFEKCTCVWIPTDATKGPWPLHVLNPESGPVLDACLKYAAALVFMYVAEAIVQAWT